ncbi:MAG TPA: hypothetical protein VH413_20625 [Verrucomicrobiae bacterium]|nr:hypothetical protein [Verrucomicrobiae bacterium]
MAFQASFFLSSQPQKELLHRLKPRAGVTVNLSSQVELIIAIHDIATDDRQMPGDWTQLCTLILRTVFKDASEAIYEIRIAIGRVALNVIDGGVDIESKSTNPHEP